MATTTGMVVHRRTEVRPTSGWPLTCSGSIRNTGAIPAHRASPSGCALRQRASTWRRQIRTIICQSRRTCWRRSSRRQGRTARESGITHVATEAGWLYVSVVLALYSRPADQLGDVRADCPVPVRCAAHSRCGDVRCPRTPSSTPTGASVLFSRPSAPAAG